MEIRTDNVEVKFLYKRWLGPYIFEDCDLLAIEGEARMGLTPLLKYKKSRKIHIQHPTNESGIARMESINGDTESFLVRELFVDFKEKELSFRLLKKVEGEISEGHPLESIFADVLAQVTAGKGVERHGKTEGGKDLTFFEQPIMTITRYVGNGYPLGQAMKKLSEVPALMKHKGRDAAYKEILGAIAYAAAAALNIREED